MEMPNPSPETPSDEFHYHYSARKAGAVGSRRMLDLTGRVFLSGAIVMGGAFLGGFVLIAVMLLGCFTFLLGGGAILCVGAACQLLADGFALLAASSFAGTGVCGLGLVLLGVGVLFAVAALYWVKKVVPGSRVLFQRFRGFLAGGEEARP